jgi:hypothetical protein
VEQGGADVHAKDSEQRTSLDIIAHDPESPITVFLRPYVQPKLKVYVLCIGLHCRLGVDDSPLNVLNVDMMQEIAQH